MLFFPEREREKGGVKANNRVSKEIKEISKKGGKK